jgi:hypothetical protein
MHTTTANSDLGEIVIHHNSDWSGDATIVLPGPRAAGGGREIVLPGEVVLAIGLAIGRKDVVERVIDFLEDL